MEITIGTRGSTLALTQVDIVKDLINEKISQIETETKIIVTSGDKFRDRSIEAINEKGVFTKAIDEAVLSGEVDLAVHSMKDLPMEIHPELTIASVPERAAPNDTFISKTYSNISELPENAIVGTASPRRKAQLLYARKDLDVTLIRGNVETRLEKLYDGEFDAIILAKSGLDRLGKTDVVTNVLSLQDFTPTACQGALALVTRRDNQALINTLEKVTHQDSWDCTLAERAFMHTVGGGCKTPIGVIVEPGSELELFSNVLAPDGSVRLQYRKKGAYGSPEEFGEKAAKDMLDQGGAALISRWKI